MKVFNDIVEKLNRFLYVKPKKKEPKVSYEAIIEARKKTALLIFNVLNGRLSVLSALKMFPKNIPDDSVNVCFHILVHYEADEDIRKKDPLYKEEQDEFMDYAAQLLDSGEPLPINIIKEYNGFYKETLLYPEINKATIISRLKKFINI